MEAIEPDTRGATTIREQLDKHREIQSCHACHAKFDPVGFALESFDVGGGWQSQYRAVNDEADPVIGIDSEGHPFAFHYTRPVDCSGQLMDGREFSGINELKRLFAADERAVARNLVTQFIGVLGIAQIFTSFNNPKGNADTERFFRTLKEDLIWLNEWFSFEQLLQALKNWIAQYNQDYPHSGINHRTPQQFEDQFNPSIRNKYSLIQS